MRKGACAGVPPLEFTTVNHVCLSVEGSLNVQVTSHPCPLLVTSGVHHHLNFLQFFCPNMFTWGPIPSPISNDIWWPPPRHIWYASYWNAFLLHIILSIITFVRYSVFIISHVYLEHYLWFFELNIVTCITHFELYYTSRGGSSRFPHKRGHQRGADIWFFTTRKQSLQRL